MKFLLIVVICYFSFLSANSQYPGQASVMITVTVTPPLPTSIYDLESKVHATLINNSKTELKVYVQVSLTGSGMSIRTDPSYKMPQPLVLLPGTPFLLARNNIQLVFSDHLVFEHTTKEKLMREGLPESDYDFCMQAFDYNTGSMVSAPQPAGCCQFSVTAIEPPVILSPSNGQTIYPSVPQNVPFNWTIPAGAPYNTQYALKINELLPGDKNPDDAMNSSHPVFFERTGITVNSYNFGPADPPLISGKQYACIVTASDPAKMVYFKNNGKSEVISFYYSGGQSGGQPVQITLVSPHQGDTVKDFPLFQWQITGYYDSTKNYPGIQSRLKVCEILNGQDKNKAINNSPHVLRDLTGTSFPCPHDAVEPGKSYCWQVSALLNGSVIGTSMVWDFHLPFFFSPNINLVGVIVHIENDPVKITPDEPYWRGKIRLPDGTIIEVFLKFENWQEIVPLKQCNYIRINKVIRIDESSPYQIEEWEEVTEFVKGLKKRAMDAKLAARATIPVNFNEIINAIKVMLENCISSERQRINDENTIITTLQSKSLKNACKKEVELAITNLTEAIKVEQAVLLLEEEILVVNKFKNGIEDYKNWLKEIRKYINDAINLENSNSDDRSLKEYIINMTSEQNVIILRMIQDIDNISNSSDKIHKIIDGKESPETILGRKLAAKSILNSIIDNKESTCDKDEKEDIIQKAINVLDGNIKAFEKIVADKDNEILMRYQKLLTVIETINAKMKEALEAEQQLYPPPSPPEKDESPEKK